MFAYAEDTENSTITTTVTAEGVTVEEVYTSEISENICCCDRPWYVCDYCLMGEE